MSYEKESYTKNDQSKFITTKLAKKMTSFMRHGSLAHTETFSCSINEQNLENL